MDEQGRQASAAAYPSGPGAYRSGVAARLAGLPVETLRVWERRYGVTDTDRSPHGQRLYSELQVRRLGLIKHLVDQGHPIGSVARLSVEQLRQMVAQPAERSGQTLRVALLGHALGLRIAAGGRHLLSLDIVGSATDLTVSPAVLGAPEVLLIEISELPDSAVPDIIALQASTGAACVVLYRFCASATIRQLRAHGCLVARVPADPGEIVLLCHAARNAAMAAARPRVAPSVPLRRFDDQTLTLLTASASSVGCECPRHMAEILLMLNSFERYSAQCESRNPDDAAVHQDLSHAAAQARDLLEGALERLARAEGLPMPDGLTVKSGALP
ncbi:MAG: MerR family transcriptional regulator [Pseudomonadota bacterium]